ncbi:hypothetical protein NUSPORA_02392 [Nucleospora cyclopteri]
MLINNFCTIYNLNNSIQFNKIEMNSSQLNPLICDKNKEKSQNKKDFCPNPNANIHLGFKHVFYCVNKKLINEIISINNYFLYNNDIRISFLDINYEGYSYIEFTWNIKSIIKIEAAKILYLYDIVACFGKINKENNIIEFEPLFYFKFKTTTLKQYIDKIILVFQKKEIMRSPFFITFMEKNTSSMINVRSELFRFTKPGIKTFNLCYKDCSTELKLKQ